MVNDKLQEFLSEQFSKDVLPDHLSDLTLKKIYRSALSEVRDALNAFDRHFLTLWGKAVLSQVLSDQKLRILEADAISSALKEIGLRVVNRFALDPNKITGIVLLTWIDLVNGVSKDIGQRNSQTDHNRPPEEVR